MPLRLRLSLLRLTAMAGLVVSALLTYDKLHPDRAFCKLAGGTCQKVGESALGTLFGVPTSVIGLGAFGGLFLLTLLTGEGARRALKLAGFLGAVGGAVFFAYQALVLGTYCPLCLVADGAGLLAGVLTLTWGKGGARGRGSQEGAGARVAWLFAALLAVVLPFAWPRAEQPSYVEIDPIQDLDDDDAPAPKVDVAARPTKPEPVPSATPPARVPPGSRQGIPPRPGTAPTPAPTATPPKTTVPVPPPMPGTNVVPSKPPPSAPAATTKPPATTAPAPVPGEILVVEYLNAYCPHCRATDARLEKVVAEGRYNVRKRRVYTWATMDYPAWARALALAQTVGLEDRMFEELLRSRGPELPEVKAAAQRAGLDAAALEAALKDPNPPPRLVKDRQLFTQARLQGLPTLDIGRRRLMGEQSEAELRAALEAARPPAAPPPR